MIFLNILKMNYRVHIDTLMNMYDFDEVYLSWNSYYKIENEWSESGLVTMLNQIRKASSSYIAQSFVQKR